MAPERSSRVALRSSGVWVPSRADLEQPPPLSAPALPRRDHAGNSVSNANPRAVTSGQRSSLDFTWHPASGLLRTAETGFMVAILATRVRRFNLRLPFLGQSEARKNLLVRSSLPPAQSQAMEPVTPSMGGDIPLKSRRPFQRISLISVALAVAFAIFLLLTGLDFESAAVAAHQFPTALCVIGIGYCS